LERRQLARFPLKVAEKLAILPIRTFVRVIVQVGAARHKANSDAADHAERCLS
jgi:hypothetical protein